MHKKVQPSLPVLKIAASSPLASLPNPFGQQPYYLLGSQPSERGLWHRLINAAGQQLNVMVHESHFSPG